MLCYLYENGLNIKMSWKRNKMIRPENPPKLGRGVLRLFIMFFNLFGCKELHNALTLPDRRTAKIKGDCEQPVKNSYKRYELTIK